MSLMFFSDDMRKKITFLLLDHILLSGSVLTTAINTLANFLIFLSICINKPKTDEECLRAVEKSGYVVTMGANLYGKPGLWQFLKYSPVWTAVHGCVPVLNMGPWIRRVGNIIGDYPGRSDMTVMDRADSHVAADKFHVW